MNLSDLTAVLQSAAENSSPPTRLDNSERLNRIRRRIRNRRKLATAAVLAVSGIAVIALRLKGFWTYAGTNCSAPPVDHGAPARPPSNRRSLYQ
jgi:hypothetical protein